MMMLSRHRNRRTRGAAYAEAVIMLPVFMILMWGYYLLYNGHGARRTAMAGARTSAWEASMEGCGLLDEATNTCESCGDSPGEGPLAPSGVFDSLTSGSMSWLGDIIGGLFGPLVGRQNNAEYDAHFVPEDSLRDGGTVRARMQVVCNTKRETLLGIIKQALCRSGLIGGILDFIGDFCS